ncbi:MAG: C-terminal binding protein [Rectinemataceae bacterium]
MTGPTGRRPLVVVTDDRFGDADIERELLESAGVELLVAKCRSSGDVAAAGGEADGLLVNLAPVDAAAIEALPRCRVISRYGAGLDNIDVEAAHRHGIAVTSVSGYCDIEVAEHALGLIFACARGIAGRDRGIREGAWDIRPYGRRIAGTRLGILGFGGTARELARASLSLGFRDILVWSPHISAERIAAGLGSARSSFGTSVRPAGFDELISTSDWISLHLPLKAETRGLFGAGRIAAMRRDAVIVNVSRGGLIDEEALCSALAGGRLGGAGLDVFAAEPLPAGSRLRSLPNVVLSDHSAYASRESITELRRRAAENALRGLRDTAFSAEKER